jgi:adenylate cyclase class 2
MPDEVEIKFLIHDLAGLQARLRAAGLRQKTPRTFEHNTLYDNDKGQLRKRGELLRLRRYGDVWTLTHKAKGRSGPHKTRVELQSRVHDGEAVHSILLALGYRPGFRYEKYREEWTDDQGDVVIDETPIGNVAEIEGPPQWIDKTAALLGVDRRDYLTTNYAQLFFDWKKRTRSRAQDMTFAAVQGAKP